MKYGGHMYGRRTGRREKLWRKEEGNLALRNLQGYICCQNIKSLTVFYTMFIVLILMDIEKSFFSLITSLFVLFYYLSLRSETRCW
jgi:hypothetical protein